MVRKEAQAVSISQPTIIREPDGLFFTWERGDEKHIIVALTRINQEFSRNSIEAEIEIAVDSEIYHNPDGNPSQVVGYSRTNLLSLSAREALIRHIEKTCMSEVALFIPWQQLINQVATYAIREIRKGEPVIELNTAGEIKPPEYLLYPLIVKNYPNVIFGDPSASKSTLAVILAQVVMLPWSDNPMGLLAPKEHKRVLYLDWETDANTIQWQTTMLQRGIEGAEILFLNYRRCSRPLSQDTEQIKAHITEAKADLIIIDSLGLAAGGELKETQSALGFFAALRNLETTSLILAHNSKDRESKTRSIFGSMFFTAQSRNVWELRKEQDSDSNELNIALFHRKPPPFAGMHKPLGFKLLYDNEAGKMTIEHSDPKTVGEFLAQMGVQERILDFLKDGAKSVEEITKELGATQNTISVSLNKLKKKTRVVAVSRGVWGLVAPGILS